MLVVPSSEIGVPRQDLHHAPLKDKNSTGPKVITTVRQVCNENLTKQTNLNTMSSTFVITILVNM